MHVIALNADGSPPEGVQLLPAGPHITGRDGRAFVFDRPELVLEAFRTHDGPLPVDWEHATEHRAPNGLDAPAAGWIVELEERGGELWGRVEWTSRGADHVASREYRFLSPVVAYARDTQRVLQLVSAGLTNQPNFKMTALNQRQGGQEMDITELLQALGLSPEATVDEAVKAANRLQADLNTAKALNAAEPPVDTYVPRADYDVAEQRAANAEKKLAKVEADALEAEIETALADALKAGKITPATEGYHKAQCRQEGGLERFKAFVASAPAVAGNSGLDDKKPESAAKALNATEQAVADMFGNSPEDLAKYGQ